MRGGFFRDIDQPLATKSAVFEEPGLTVVYECCCNVPLETLIRSKG